MTMRAALLSLATLLGITLWGLGIYTGSSLAGNVAADGYGVSAAAGER